MVIAKPCRILRDKDKEVIFEIDEGPLTIKLRQGRVWTARLKDRDLGAVYKTGPCWGAKGFYACDRGRILRGLARPAIHRDFTPRPSSCGSLRRPLGPSVLAMIASVAEVQPGLAWTIGVGPSPGTM